MNHLDDLRMRDFDLTRLVLEEFLALTFHLPNSWRCALVRSVHTVPEVRRVFVLGGASLTVRLQDILNYELNHLMWSFVTYVTGR